MLLKKRKRIAALLTAVVVSFTTAFSLPVMAEEETATGSDAKAETTETTEELVTTEENLEDLGDQGETVYVHSRYWDSPKWIISDYVDVTATDYTPSLHGSMKVTDTSGRETEGYCMQSTKNSAQTDTAYTEGRGNWLSEEETAADIALMMFAYGGRRADPNAYDGRNDQDGGTYGTYIINGVPNGGLMISGKVYAMTRDEARAVTQVAVHSTVSDCAISAVYGKSSGANVNNAFLVLKKISNAAAALRANGNSLERVAELVDNTAAYKPVQSITTQVYNVTKKAWENYSGSKLTDAYKDASGNVTFRFNYSSSGFCNKLLTNASSASGKVTVTHSGAKMTVNGSENYYDYLTVAAASGNTAAFTVDYGALTNRTQTVRDTLVNWDITQEVFEQTATIKAKYKDLQDGALAVKVSTGSGAAHTPFHGDGDRNGKVYYAARIYNNAAYQDVCFTSPNQSVQTSASLNASAQKLGTIKVHKKSTNTAVTDGNANYSLKDAIFGVFKTKADAQAVKNYVATFRTDENGYGSVGNLQMGTYYLMEITAPKGYKRNSTIYTVNMSTDTPYSYAVPQNPNTTSIKIHKYSANTDVTKGNACYSLENAEFGVFKTKANAQAGKNAVATIKTDKNGDGSVSGLAFGTYYIKETKASKGYRVNTTIYTASAKSNTAVTFKVPETPQGDPASVLVRKKDSEKTVYLEGCVFAVKYYDVQMSTDPAKAGKKAVRTWYLKTDNQGFADLKSSNYLQSNSSPLYYNEFGSVTIPIGTITIQETKAPEGYVIDKTIHTFKITDNPTGVPHIDVDNARTIPNDKIKRPFELMKLAEGKNNTTSPLANAGFSACRADSLKQVTADYIAKEGEVIVQDDTGKYYIWDAEKAVILTSGGKTEMFTDKDGHAASVALEYGKYIVRETTVPHNYHPIDAFTVNITESGTTPVQMGYFTDKSFKAYLKIIKKDDTTGQKILSDAATFKIWSYDDEAYVEFDQEDGKKVSEFKTVKGELMTPGTLMPGKYRIEETECPNGYYNKLKKQSYDITIDADAVYKIYETPEGQVTDMGVFEFEIENTPIKGSIKITKNGEKRKFNETTGKFETEEVKLSGITFRIYADEDILTSDGSGDTLYAKDSLVETVITDESGVAESKQLPIGTYRVEEETPEEYVDMKPVTFKLVDGKKTEISYPDGTVKEKITYSLTVKNVLKVPDIKTKAKDTKGNQQVLPTDSVALIDTVSCSNIMKGYTYKIIGYPVYKDTEKRVSVNGKLVENSVTFTAKADKQDVDVSYTFNVASLAGKSIVFYEYLYLDDELVAEHKDINDLGQTIAFADIHTTAKDNQGGKTLRPVGTVTIIDTADYENLLPGKYKIIGYPVYKDTGKRVSINGKNIENSVEFTAEGEKGCVDVPYTFDASSLAGKSIVFYEYVYLGDTLVLKHEDINDEWQTIKFEDTPDTPKTGDSAKPLIPIAIGLVAAAGIVVMIILKKKHK